MREKTGPSWNATVYDKQKAFGVVLPSVTKAWADSVTYWWREKHE